MRAGGPILVTGAGGFVCSEIALACARAGAAVIAVDQHFDSETKQRLNGIQMVEGDLLQVLSDGVGPYSTSIHGAALTASPERLGISRAAHIRRNMNMLTATLDAAKASGAVQFLFLSSMGVFEHSDGPHTGAFTEATRPSADCPYCAAKRAGEMLNSSAGEEGFTTLSLRLGNIFGPHEAVRETRQNLCLVARMVSEARETGVISVQNPDAEREWSWLPDLATVIAKLVDSGLPQSGPRILHAGTPPVTNDLTLARLIADRITGTTIRVANPPQNHVRPPMASEVASVFSNVNWTKIATALDQLIPAEVTT